MRKLKSFKNLFKRSWDLFKSRIGVFIGISSVVLLSQAFVASIEEGTIAFTIATILNVYVSLLAGLALIYSIIYKLSFVKAYNRALEGIWQYIWISLLSSLLIVGGLFLGIIPGIIFAVWFSLAGYVFVAEGEKGLNALLKSKEYIREHWWDLVWKSTLLFAISLLIFLPVAIPFVVFQESTPLVFHVIESALSMLMGIFWVVFMFEIYKDFTHIKPELVDKKNKDNKFLWVLVAIWGIIAPIVLLAIITILTLSANNSIENFPYEAIIQ